MLTINQCYLDFVDKILKTGKETYKDSNHHLLESLGNFYIIDDPLNLKFRAKYQNYTTDMMLADIKAGKFDMEGNPIKSDALYNYELQSTRLKTQKRKTFHAFSSFNALSVTTN